jgi:heme/copper-type cytochrome/quinol oxidase subunit 2
MWQSQNCEVWKIDDDSSSSAVMLMMMMMMVMMVMMMMCVGFMAQYTWFGVFRRREENQNGMHKTLLSHSLCMSFFASC